MSEKALVRTLNKSLEVKSLKDLVRVRTATGDGRLAIDCSGSMGVSLIAGGSRIQALVKVVEGLRKTRKIDKMIAFGVAPYAAVVEAGNPTEANPMASIFGDQAGASSHPEVKFVTEVPLSLGPSTPLAEAIDLAAANGDGRLVIISDGVPNDMYAAKDAARRFGGQIDVIFIGEQGEVGSAFLEDLARMTGGQRINTDLSDLNAITGVIAGLLGGDVMEEDDEDDDMDDDDDDDDDDEDDDED